MRDTLIALIMLTQLDGAPIWVESTAVIIVRTQSHECQSGKGSSISVMGRGLCVRETVDVIREKVKEGNSR